MPRRHGRRGSRVVQPGRRICIDVRGYGHNQSTTGLLQGSHTPSSGSAPSDRLVPPDLSQRRLHTLPGAANGVFVALDEFYESVTFMEPSRPGFEFAVGRGPAPLDLSRRPSA